MRLMKVLILASLFGGVFSGCGGGQSDSGNTAPPSSLAVYQFTATIDSYADSSAPFPATVGQVITGTMSYDPLTLVRVAPAGVQLKIGSITLNSDLSSFNPPIVIQNDLADPPSLDGSPTTKRDVFQWTTFDTRVAAQYGLDDIQMVIYLEDTTATVFNNNQLPANLSFNAFTRGAIFLNKENRASGTVAYGSAKITSLTRVQ